MGKYLPDGVERVLLRLAAPHDYRTDLVVHGAVVDHLNHVLALEGLTLVLDGVQPKLQPRAAHVPSAPKKSQPVPPPDFELLTAGDQGLAEILTRRWEEAQRCVEAGAHLSAVIMIGSVLEGALLARVFADRETACRARAAPRDKRGGLIQPEEWKLTSLIDVAHEVGWLHGDVKAIQPRAPGIPEHCPSVSRTRLYAGSSRWGYLFHLLDGCPGGSSGSPRK